MVVRPAICAGLRVPTKMREGQRDQGWAPVLVRRAVQMADGVLFVGGVNVTTVMCSR
jgi:hypothetical protein